MAARRFAATYQVDLSDAEHPLEGYGSLHELFTRRLRPGARPIDQDPEALVSPVDGTLSERGFVGAGVLPQAKGRTYTLSALLADPQALEVFGGGSFATLYLHPRDYHRIHSPVDGRISRWVHVPGDLFPVNSTAVAHFEALFARNERLMTHLDTDVFGRVAVVKVGATIVGRVRASYAPEVTTNAPGVTVVRRADLDPAAPIGRGDELGVFEMGSTVIVVTERPLRFEVEAGRPVRFGESLGRIAAGRGSRQGNAEGSPTG